MPKSKDYYFTQSKQLGWGEDSAKIDGERINLLKKYIVGKNVLDIGCGSGIYVDFLNKEGYQASGVDFVEDFIKLARKNKKGEFFISHAEKLPFKNNEFETVILFDILEHGDDRKIIGEAKRVSKKRIIVIVPQVVDSLLSESGVIYRHYIDKSHLREYTFESIKKLAQQQGLSVVNIQNVHPLFNETVFLSLFTGPKLLKKILRKIVLILLRKRYLPTEIFAVLDK
jgi:ubiquinone/menaquinone biosynthesis C-methylase UbiE